jgi:hypothetical protein
MTSAAELVARCRALGIELGVGSGGASLLWEADADPPADLLTDLAANKAAVLALVRGPFGNCDKCGRALDDKRRCWRCCDRVCVDCGRWTGSALIQRCVPCGQRYANEDADAATRVIAAAAHPR